MVCACWLVGDEEREEKKVRFQGDGCERLRVSANSYASSTIGSFYYKSNILSFINFYTKKLTKKNFYTKNIHIHCCVMRERSRVFDGIAK